MATLGLDKLSFLLPLDQVKITPDFAPVIERGPLDGATLEPLPERVIYTVGGVARCGRVAHFNSKDFQFAISPDRKSDNSICKLQFSAGAFRESNLEVLSLEETCDVARRVQRTLKQNGVSFDFKLAKLFRLDIAQNCSMSHPIASYSSAFAAVKARKCVRKTDHGVTGFYISNKSMEIGFYDKGEQMQILGYEPELWPVNSLRPEVRLKKSQLIRTSLACSSLSELPEAWPRLRTVYNHFLERDVFKPRNDKNASPSLEFEQVAALANAKSPCRAWSGFLREVGLLTLEQHLGLGAAKHFAASEFGIDGSTKSGAKQLERIYTQLDDAAFRIQMHGTARTGHKVKELYKELRERVLAV